MDEKRHVFHYNYKGYLMYYMMCLCVYFYIGGLAHPHGVLHGSGGPYAFVFFLFFCGCTPCRLFTSPFIHAYTPPFFAFICTIARPYSLRFIRIGTPRVRPPNCMAFAGSSSALVRTTQEPPYEPKKPLKVPTCLASRVRHVEYPAYAVGYRVISSSANVEKYNGVWWAFTRHLERMEPYATLDRDLDLLDRTLDLYKSLGPLPC
jgi:hypothetical protein